MDPGQTRGLDDAKGDVFELQSPRRVKSTSKELIYQWHCKNRDSDKTPDCINAIPTGSMVSHNKWGKKKLQRELSSHSLTHEDFRSSCMAVIYHPYWPITVPGRPASNELQQTQWNKSRYEANKLLKAVWDFLFAFLQLPLAGGERNRTKKEGEAMAF